jgi:mannose-1-phosphate guanylyltransferase/mannose-6-phosphate isomerase
MGARLWPVSRMEQPKQFQPVSGKGSLSYFQNTLQRHRGARFHDPIVATSAQQIPLVHRQLRDLQLNATVIAEPVGRNTGPAVLAAALTTLQSDPDATLLVLPSDHIIKGDLNTTVLAMHKAAQNGRIVLFGVPPSYPETGYGYIIDGGVYGNYPGLNRVERFIEKPAYDQAISLFTQGFSYWASGISLFRADVIVEEFQRFDPHTLKAVSAAVEDSTPERGHTMLEATSFIKATSEPTERLVFERSTAVALAPARDIEWDDVGAWNSVQNVSIRNEHGNVINGDVLAYDTHNSLIQSDSRLVAVIGLRDMIVVDTPDALLVMKRDNAQNVKQVVEQLKFLQRTEVQTHLLRETNWGRVETLSKAQGYDMRMLVVAPGATLRVNGTGHGPSLLTFINDGGLYEKDGAILAAKRGDSVTIAPDVTLPLTNTSTRELRAMQLMLTPTGEVAPGAMPPVNHPVPPLFSTASHDAALADAPRPAGPGLAILKPARQGLAS